MKAAAFLKTVWTYLSIYTVRLRIQTDINLNSLPS
jgi:hypothetical protein